MLPFPLPINEAARIELLHGCGVLDTPAETEFDDLTRLAAQLCGVPIALISLVDRDRQWFKSRRGLAATETPRDLAFCAHAIVSPERLLVVPDAREDSRFAENPLVTGETGIRFYAGAPLLIEDGTALGTLCVIDRQPRELSAEQKESLAALARQVVTQIRLRRQNEELRLANARLENFFALPLDMLCIATAEGCFKLLNPAFTEALGYGTEELLAASLQSFVHPDDVSRTRQAVERLAKGLGTQHLENRFRCKDGTYRWLAWRGAYGADGLIYASFRDVTEQKETDAKLRTISELQSAILHSAGYSVIATTADGVITVFNPAAERMLGYSAEEVVGRATPAIFHLHDEVIQQAAEVSAELGEEIQPGVASLTARTRRHLPNESEWNFVRKDGSKFPVQLSITGLWNDANEIVGFLGLFIDITKRKSAEARLMASEQRFREAIEYSAIGMALVGLDGSWLKVNRSLCTTVGRSEEELLRCTFQDITHPDDLDADLANVHELIAGKIDHYQMEKRYFHKEGHILWVLLAVTLVRDAQGEPAYFVSQIRDITARLTAEARLVASERRFREAVEFSAIGMALVGLDGTWLKVNRALCDIVGRSEAEMQECTFQDITHPDDLEINLGNAQSLLDGDITRYHMEKRYFHRDGHIVWALVTVTLVRDGDGKPDYFVTQVQDITERREAVERLKDSIGEKEALLQEVHHRVKNNLQVVSSLLALQSDYISEPQMLAQFQECQGRIRSMALIHEKLYQSERLSRVDLRDYLESLSRIIHSTYATRGKIRLELQLAYVLSSMDTAVPLGLLVNELLTNALKYAFPQRHEGTICVALEVKDAGRFTLTIADDGAGLPPEFRVDQARTLGMKLVGMFVKQLRAKMEMNSHPGCTRFVIHCGGGVTPEALPDAA